MWSFPEYLNLTKKIGVEAAVVQAERHLPIQWIRIHLCLIEFHRKGFHSRENMPRQINEDQTRKQMIVPQLEHAGWYLCDHSNAIGGGLGRAEMLHPPRSNPKT
jgi:hypothetical protein